MLLRNLIIEYTDRLKDISSTARLDVEIMISEVLKYDDKVQLIMDYNREIKKSEIESFEALFEKRLNNMPIAYITNKKEFMGLTFYVDENVLIPRPDTEVVAEEFISKIKNLLLNRDGEIIALDMCVGSGAILLSCARILKDELDKNTFERIKFIGVDISPKALNITKMNMQNFQLDNIMLVESNLFGSNVLDCFKSNIDIIVSNPPYIENSVIKTLEPDVRDYEPIIALSGGDSGMDFYNSIIESSVNYLKNGGLLIFEAGHNQAEKIESKMKSCNFHDIYTKKDIQNFDRLVCGKFKV